MIKEIAVVAALISTPAFAQQFDECKGSNRVTCVVDGDTFWLNREKIRIADIDTPETQPGQFKCESERSLGKQATSRLIDLLNAGPFDLDIWERDRDRDRAGRKLRVVSRDGQSIGMQLVHEGLARRWDGRRHPWCN